MNTLHALHEAAREGDLEKVQALVKDNPDLVFSNTPLRFWIGWR
jgi:hypothetical protein